MYHRTKSLGALNVKAGVKTREHDSIREHGISREPPGYCIRERVLLPESSSRWPWSDVFSTWTSPRGCINKGMLDFLSEEKTMCCTKLLLERAVYCQEQDGETTRRTAHRSRPQAWRSSRPSAPCPADREEHHLLQLSFVGEISSRFCLLFFFE